MAMDKLDNCRVKLPVRWKRFVYIWQNLLLAAFFGYFATQKGIEILNSAQNFDSFNFIPINPFL